MTKIKCNCKVVYTRNPDVLQKALSERSHFMLLEGTLNNAV